MNYAANSPLKNATNGTSASLYGKETDMNGSPLKKDFNSPEKYSAENNRPLASYSSPSALQKSKSPGKKYGSPSSPAKKSKPFGKPLEIIRSKYQFQYPMELAFNRGQIKSARASA
jgi:hypothetical protein